MTSKMNIKIVITWYKNNPAGFWFNDKLIWETEEVVTESDLIETKISLPLYEAVKFSSVFIAGLTAARLGVLLIAIDSKIKELKRLQKQEEQKESDDEWDNANISEEDN